MRSQILNYVVLLLVTVMAAGCQQKTADTGLKSWALGPFERPEGVNPLIEPDTTTFYCPLTEGFVQWESGDTFNPAVLKDDTICVLYRAEDRSEKDWAAYLAYWICAIRRWYSLDQKSRSRFVPFKDDQMEYEWREGVRILEWP